MTLGDAERGKPAAEIQSEAMDLVARRNPSRAVRTLVEDQHPSIPPPIFPPPPASPVRCVKVRLTMCEDGCYICKVPRVHSSLPVSVVFRAAPVRVWKTAKETQLSF